MLSKTTLLESYMSICVLLNVTSLIVNDEALLTMKRLSIWSIPNVPFTVFNVIVASLVVEMILTDLLMYIALILSDASIEP